MKLEPKEEFPSNGNVDVKEEPDQDILEEEEDFDPDRENDDFDEEDEDFEPEVKRHKKRKIKSPKHTKIVKREREDEEETEPKYYQCYKCGEMIFSKKTMAEHQKAEHNGFHYTAYGEPRDYQVSKKWQNFGPAKPNNFARGHFPPPFKLQQIQDMYLSLSVPGMQVHAGNRG